MLMVLEGRGRRARSARSASCWKTRCAISGSPASICRAEQKARYREVAQRLAQLATKFSENVLDAGRAYTRSVTDSAELAGLPAQRHRSRRGRCARGESSRVGCSSSISRPT